MKARVKRNKGYIDLFVEKKNQSYLVMRIDKPTWGIAWEIFDFRLSTQIIPTTRPITNDVQHFKITDEARKYEAELFPFPVKEKDGYWLWYRNDGIVLEGHDYPLEKQREKANKSRVHGLLITEGAVWKKEGALAKLREAKEFWKNFEGDWEAAKIENPHLRPPGDIMMQQQLEALVEFVPE